MDSNQKSALGILAAVSAVLFASSRMGASTAGSFSRRRNSRGQTIDDGSDAFLPLDEQEMRRFLMELDFGGEYSKGASGGVDGIGHSESGMRSGRFSSAYVQQLYDYAMGNLDDPRAIQGVKADLRQILNDPYRDEQTKMEAAEVYDLFV